MFFIILGLILFVVGLVMAKNTDNVRRFSGRALRIIGLLVIVMGIITACIIQIEAGEVGVKKLFGEV